MGRKIIQVKPSGYTTSYQVTAQSLSPCAKLVNGNNLVSTLTIGNQTGIQTPFEIEFGSCTIDPLFSFTITDSLGCTVVEQSTVSNPYKVVCINEDDFGMSFIAEEYSWVHPNIQTYLDVGDQYSLALAAALGKADTLARYGATRTGTFSNPSSVASDVIKYSVDGGNTWITGDTVGQSQAFNTFARITPMSFSTTIEINSIVWPKTHIFINFNAGIINVGGVWTGTGLNFISVDQQNLLLAGTAFPNQSGPVSLGAGGMIGSSISNYVFNSNPTSGSVTDWIATPVEKLKFEAEFDDGYKFDYDFSFTCPYVTATDPPATVDVSEDISFVRAGSQRDFRFKRIITFNDACPNVIIEYSMNVVDIVNDQTVPYIVGTRI